MKMLLKTLLPIVVLGLSALGAKWLVDSRPEPQLVPPAVVIPTVRTLQVERSDYRVKVPARGTVVPRTQSDIVAQVGGRVVAVSPNLVAGGFFEAGEVLVELDARDYELALAQAQLVVTQAERRLAEEEADAAVARREWEELGKGEPSPLTVREPQVKEARAALEAARAGRARAELDIERSKLKATFAGRVRSKNVDLGQFVMPGSAVARVYAVDFAEVRLPLSDRELAFLDLPVSYRDRKADGQGPLVQLSAQFAGGRREWAARIVRTEGEIDPKTRMVIAVARVEDPYGRALAEGGDGVPLAVGMFVSAEIQGCLLEQVLVLPRSALRDGPQVYVLTSDDRLLMLDIEPLRSTRDEVVVHCPEFEDGARVVVSPLEIATREMRVKDLGPGDATDSATGEH